MLNENEKIESWTITVRTIDRSKAHGIGRELSFNDLGLEIYYPISKQIDETLEALYPCTWQDDN
ncbi:hypothetical protein LCGC14_1567070 [marine sediment metagenome]|uniref:Uncharacterized protein n=1 Tax=marine sediment metagenome TaxID=412755 RepID=A0A0F9L1U7_9ZZZZ